MPGGRVLSSYALIPLAAAVLAACGGDAPEPPAPRTSTPSPVAATPAPVDMALSPTATPAPTPIPEVCTRTTLGQQTDQVPDLAKDCNILMAAKDALRGTGTLNWSADTAMTGWDGVTVSGTPSRVTGLALSRRDLTGSVPPELGALSALRTLDLSWNKLRGSIPAVLGDLGELRSLSLYRTSLTGSIPSELTGLSSLERLFLGENAFTGCLPRALRLVANHDLATLGLENCALPSVSLTYDTYDTTGAVTTAGSYAFLTNGEDGLMTTVTTYKALRDGTTTMLKLNTSDAGDASHADFYAEVEEGDLIEWSEADDCFVRYRVTDASAASEGATSREFGVQPETYAWQSCQTGLLPTGGSGGASGVAATTAMTITVGTALPLEHLGGINLTSFAVVHGVWQLVPDGVIQPSGEKVPGSSILVEQVTARPLTPLAHTVPHVRTGSLEEAKQLPYWRDPQLPEGWTLAGVRSGGYADTVGYVAYYGAPGVMVAVTIRGEYGWAAPTFREASWTADCKQYCLPAANEWQWVTEARVIAGRPATVSYSPLGPQHDRATAVTVEVYDPATGAIYAVQGVSGSRGLRGGPAAAERVTAIACSLFLSASECTVP